MLPPDSRDKCVYQVQNTNPFASLERARYCPSQVASLSLRATEGAPTQKLLAVLNALPTRLGLFRVAIRQPLSIPRDFRVDAAFSGFFVIEAYCGPWNEML